jgi:hypothetical protein
MRGPFGGPPSVEQFGLLPKLLTDIHEVVVPFRAILVRSVKRALKSLAALGHCECTRTGNLSCLHENFLNRIRVERRQYHRITVLISGRRNGLTVASTGELYVIGRAIGSYGINDRVSCGSRGGGDNYRLALHAGRAGMKGRFLEVKGPFADEWIGGVSR